MKETIDLFGKILTNILTALYEPFGFSLFLSFFAMFFYLYVYEPTAAGKGSSAEGIAEYLLLRHSRILLEQHIHESLLFFDKILNSEETCPCEVLESFITVVSHIYLFVDSTETQAVSNNKRVHIIILWQVIVSIVKLLDLLRIEDMNLSVKRCQSGIFP